MKKSSKRGGISPSPSQERRRSGSAKDRKPGKTGQWRRSTDPVELGRAILLGPAVYEISTLKRIVNALKLTERDQLIGIDGGTLVWLELGVVPDFCIGDWDSLTDRKQRQAVLHHIPHMTLPTRKDRSDLYHAARLMQELGVKEFVFLGVSGGRPDHHIASLLELAELSRQPGVKSVDAYGEDAGYFFLSKQRESWSARLKRGQMVSVFAMSGPVQGVKLKGFEYALHGETLEPSSHGLSNTALGQQVEVSFREPRRNASLLVVVPAT